MSLTDDQKSAARDFLRAFGLDKKVSIQETGAALFRTGLANDVDASKRYVENFIDKCATRDQNSARVMRKHALIAMNESNTTPLAMDFLVKCRQNRLFYHCQKQKTMSTAMSEMEVSGGNGMINQAYIDRTSSVVSSSSSPFQRRSVSRGRVLGSSGTEPVHDNVSHERQRSNTAANLSFEGRRLSSNPGIPHHMVLSSERGIPRAKSPFRVLQPHEQRTYSSHVRNMSERGEETMPTSAHNQLFNFHNGSSNGNHRDPVDSNTMVTVESSFPYEKAGGRGFETTTNVIKTISSADIPTTPLNARMGTAFCETDASVCECLLAALLGIESRLIRMDGSRRMSISMTASLNATQQAIVKRVLITANGYCQLNMKQNTIDSHPFKTALNTAVRQVLGEYVADTDAVRKSRRKLNFVRVLTHVDRWLIKLELLAKCAELRRFDPITAIEYLYRLKNSFGIDEKRDMVISRILDYTLSVFCKQMLDWMMKGELPAEPWLIENKENGQFRISKVPIFMTPEEVQILFEIGKSRLHIDSTDDKGLEDIAKAQAFVASRLTPALVLEKELFVLLGGLRDVVCGVAMRIVLTTGRLKDHLNMATSFFFLSNPRYAESLYETIKETSLGLRVGSASLTRQQVSTALANALEDTHGSRSEDYGTKSENKLQFSLDSITSLGHTPNTSSRMQFIQPLHPKYDPKMDLVKPIFSACDTFYEEIFHMIWALDLSRISSKAAASLVAPISRFLQLNFPLRENASSIVRMFSHTFYVINLILARVRSVVSVQVEKQFSRLLAAIDESCVDVDDIIEAHVNFARRAMLAVFLGENDEMAQPLQMLMQLSFEAQDVLKAFTDQWEEVINLSAGDMSKTKLGISSLCKEQGTRVRLLLDKVNSVQIEVHAELEKRLAPANYDIMFD